MVVKVRKTKVQPPPGCPVGACMELLGGVWTPDVIWYLSEGPRRFSELRRDLPLISAKVLSARLKDLERRGVVVRTVVPTSPPTVEYALSDLGRELVPVILKIVEVGNKLRAREVAAEALQS